MDMNDILNQWDKIQADKVTKQKQSGKNTVSHKKANAPTKEEKELAAARRAEKDFEAQMRTENSKEVNPMELWLRRYGTIDKDKMAEEAAEKHQQLDRNYILNMRPEATIDLHGLHQDEAEQQLNYFIGNCKAKGLHKVMIIHGKGIHTSGTDPVLGELVGHHNSRIRYCLIIIRNGRCENKRCNTERERNTKRNF